jgi:hypothetical protein
LTHISQKKKVGGRAAPFFIPEPEPNQKYSAPQQLEKEEKTSHAQL